MQLGGIQSLELQSDGGLDVEKAMLSFSDAIKLATRE